MGNHLWIAIVREALTQTTQYAGAFFDLSKKDATAIGTDLDAIELTNNFTPTKAMKLKLLCVTLCFHKAVPFALCK